MAQTGGGGGGEGKVAKQPVLGLQCTQIETWIRRKALEVRIWLI